MITLSDVIGLQTGDPTSNKGLVFTLSTCFLFCSKDASNYGCPSLSWSSLHSYYIIKGVF